MELTAVDTALCTRYKMYDVAWGAGDGWTPVVLLVFLLSSQLPSADLLKHLQPGWFISRAGVGDTMMIKKM